MHSRSNIKYLGSFSGGHEAIPYINTEVGSIKTYPYKEVDDEATYHIAQNFGGFGS